MSLWFSSSDIIAAEATPAGQGGISVIRLSGKGCAELTARHFDRELPPPGSHRFGRLFRDRAAPSTLIDEVVLIHYAAPHSYTGEDVIEISTHGSPVVVAEALEALYASGVRPAQPGEFTLRAFLNGRMDLTQAEAVADLIAAGSRQSADQARRQLSGGIGKAARQISDLTARLLSYQELELDFVEDDVELVGADEKLKLMDEALVTMEGMLAGYAASRRLREGVRVAITGPPNVGKSSLFNALAGEDHAIVHDTPGTTRDVLRASCVIKGISFELFDTAGIRESLDVIEDEGVRRALKVAENAEIRLEMRSVDVIANDFVIANEVKQSPSGSPSTPLSSPPQAGGSESAVIASQSPALGRLAKQSHPKTINVLNKVDIPASKPREGEIPLSVKTGAGLEELKEALYQLATGGSVPSESAISRERHYTAVVRARDAFIRAKEAVKRGFTGELIAEELRDALSALDELTGARRLENLLDEIFAGFCIGK